MFQINFNSSAPIYEQIELQAQFLIASGAWPEGELIPSVREVAKTLAINPQTVARAYGNLKTSGLIQPRRGLGNVVSIGAKDRCRRSRLLFFQSKIEEALKEATLGGLSTQETNEIVQAALQKIVSRNS